VRYGNIVLLKMHILKMLIFRSLKNTIINSAKTRNDSELYQSALRMFLSFTLLVYAYSINYTVSAPPRSLKSTRFDEEHGS